MTDKNQDCYVAIDGGTTNTRVRLFRGSELAAEADRTVGVRDVAIAGNSAPLQHAVADSLSEVLQQARLSSDQLALICASGMLTSNVGLHEVSHVPAPAGLDELARHVVMTDLPTICSKPICFVPGIKTQRQSATLEELDQLDMMRGEESEAIGLLEGRHGPMCILLPGSHTKLLHVDEANRITGSYTTMAGEVMQTMAERTVLASSINWPPSGNPRWGSIDTGAKLADQLGLLRGGFAVRLAEVLAGTSREECTWIFVGLVVGADLKDLNRWHSWPVDMPVLVGGREPLGAVYAHLLHSRWRIATEEAAEETVQLAAARGAIAIAMRFQRLHSTAH